MRFVTMNSFATVFGLACICFLPQVQAQSTWNTATDGVWSTASNWSPVGVPNGATDDALINATGTPYTVTGDNDVTLQLLTLDSSDATLLLLGRSWIINDKIQVDAGTLDLRGTTNISGNVVNGTGGNREYSGLQCQQPHDGYNWLLDQRRHIKSKFDQRGLELDAHR